MTKRNNKELASKQQEELLNLLKDRFEKNMSRHKGGKEKFANCLNENYNMSAKKFGH